MSEAWRSFIAIELPESALGRLADLQAALKRHMPERGVRWTRPESIHLTLKFLGDVPRSQIDAIQAALDAAVQGAFPFALAVEQVGCFPNTTRPRIVWAGVGGNTSALRQVQAAIETHVAPLGYPTEKRPFSPHLTLGRVQRGASRDTLAAIGRAVDGWQQGRIAGWEVRAVSLMRSDLRPDGAVYTELHRAALGDAHA